MNFEKNGISHYTFHLLFDGNLRLVVWFQCVNALITISLGIVWRWRDFKVKALIIIMKIITVCGNNCAEHTNTLHSKLWLVIFNVKAGDTKNYHCVLKGR
jgi:hypothetical protein